MRPLNSTPAKDRPRLKASLYVSIITITTAAATGALSIVRWLTPCVLEQTPLYLRHVHTRLTEELQRVENYLCQSTKKELIALVEAQLLADHLQTILEKGFDTIMDENRAEDLSLMYKLLSRVNGLQLLKQFWNQYLKVRTCRIVVIVFASLFSRSLTLHGRRRHPHPRHHLLV